MTTAINHQCPRCHAAYPTPALLGASLLCESCGHRWTARVGSDEYLPGDSGATKAVPAPLTSRRLPSDDNRIPINRSDADVVETEHGTNPSSDTSMRPSTDTSDGRIGCPVCGHAFLGQPGIDDQSCPQCGTIFSRTSGRLSASGSVDAGDRLINRVLRGCRIDRKLGEGGMGSVYHATQLSLDRSVAIKVLPPELARNRNFIQRFEREAKSLARINHPNILQIYDFGEDIQLGVYFMIIEYVDGWDIGELLRRQPYLSAVESLDIVRQALLGLEQAAEKGVIHRDIKPDNLMLATSGLCKVSDFGLAKGHHGETEVTTVGVRVGTPAFMSPEQCDGIEVDSRSDVYNLGCTMFLMLTGRLPFDGETPFSIMLKHKVDPIPSLRLYRTDVDPRVDALVQRMMAKRPSDRCEHLRELIDECEHLLVELTGTASVLRKTNGPIRALVQPAVRSGTTGKHTRKISDRMRAVAPATSPTAPASERFEDPNAIPDWLQPVNDLAPLQGQATVTAAVGSQSALARAIRGTESVKSSGPPPSLHTPFPGAATPLPEPRRSTSTTVLHPAVLDRVRERGIRAEVAAIAAGAQRLAAGGNWEQAGSEWRRASQLARDIVESRRLSDLSSSAAAQARGRRIRRRVLFTVGTLLLVGIILWVWPPVIHRLLAERERVRLDAITDPSQLSTRLREFAAANQGGWAWYRAVFGRGYDVPAATLAASAAETPTAVPISPVRDPQIAEVTPPPRTPSELNSMATDQAISWQQVIAVAKPAAAGGDKDAAAILAEAEGRLATASIARAQIDSLRGQGRHGDALDLVPRFISEHPRAGGLLDALPLPGRIQVLDSDTGVAITEAQLSVDGVILTGSTRVCRSVKTEVKVEVAALGFASQRITIAAGGSRDEGTFRVKLTPSPLWRVRAPALRPSWLRLVPIGSANLGVLSPAGVQVIRANAGTIQTITLPGMGAAPWWGTADGNGLFVTADGELRQLVTSLDRSVPVRRLGGAPLAMLDIDLVYRAGRRLTVTVEPNGDGRALIAREGGKTAWRMPGLLGKAEPLLRRADDKIVVIDDLTIQVIEEDGTMAANLPLRSPRTGPWAELPGNRLLLAGKAGVELVQLGPGGARVVANAWLNDAGPAIPAASGNSVVLARSSLRIDLADWATEAVQPRLFSRVTGRPVLASAGHGVAAIADESGSVTLFRFADGVTLRRFTHSGPLATAPLLLPGVVVVVDLDGAVAGYRIPSP